MYGLETPALVLTPREAVDHLAGVGEPDGDDGAQ